jgi:hypothetical protein
MSGISGLPIIPMYETYIKNETKYADAAAKANPATQSAVSYFQSVASTLTTPQALLKNYRALQVVLGAFGMSGLINEQGILKQLLTQNPTAKNSLVQQMANPAYLQFANVMANWNPPPLSNAKTVASIVQNYVTNQFEVGANQQMPGMQAALYFTRNIGSVTTIPELMSDNTLLGVVQTALGLPMQFGLLNYNQQVSILSQQVDLKKFQNPSYVNQFVQKYLVLNQENSASSGTANPLVNLIGGTSAFSSGTSNPLVNLIA